MVMFMKNQAQDGGPDWSITQNLLTVGNHWREQKEKSPQSLGQPLRVVLFASWLTGIRYRLDELVTNPATREQATRMGLLEGDTIPCFQWDPAAEKHQKFQQEPLTLQVAKDTIDQLQKLIIHPNVSGRFHPLRKLTPNMSSEVIPWQLQIQNRTQEAQASYQLITRFVRSGVTHLVACTLRPSKLGRSPLAVAVDRMISEL